MPSVVTIQDALASVPSLFRTRLVKHYRDLKQAYVQGAYDACGSRAGKFSETLIRYIQHELEGRNTAFGDSLNLYDESRRLERSPAASGPEPFRVFIPRALCFLYTLRNKRGFAHVGGDLDSEPVDAVTCVRTADWCLCELIRVVHQLSLEEAQTLVNSVATREVPDVWSVAGKRRVLTPGLDYKDQTLLLLYSEVEVGVLLEDLFEWTEYARINNFKMRVIKPLHQSRLVEWEKQSDVVILSPTGIAHVERNILDIAN